MFPGEESIDTKWAKLGLRLKKKTTRKHQQQNPNELTNIQPVIYNLIRFNVSVCRMHLYYLY